MKKINTHIEIVCSTAPGLSSMSQPSRDGILAVLSRHYTRVGITIVNNLADLHALAALQPDFVFLGMKFIPVDPSLGQEDPNKIWISDFLDANGITYTGSNQLAHELELNKQLAKQRVLEAGFNTSSFYVVAQGQTVTEQDIKISYPVFIKPTSRGGGAGIDSNSVANDFEQLQSKVASIAADHNSDSLIEGYLSGREFSVAILKDEDSSDYSLMPLELIAPQNENGLRLLSAAVKSADTETFVEVTDQNIKSKITELALDVFQALGARDYGRIDIRLDEKGTPHFLEANLIPSLLDGYGNFPKACLMNIDLEYEPMILSIVRLGLDRCLVIGDDLFADNILLPNSVAALAPL